MKLRSILPALLLALVLPACGGADDPVELTRAGYSQLNSGNADGARESFEGARALLQPSDPEYVRATLGLAQVLAQSSSKEDAARARDTFLELARGGAVEQGDYRIVAGALVSKRHFEEASALVEAGMTAYPESPRMAEPLNSMAL